MVLFCNKYHHIRHKGYEAGFTLVELMITVALSGIIMATIYNVYTAQQKAYLVQEQVVEMQQNIRAAIDIMEREIRMAGYDSTKAAGASITLARAGQMSFTLDNNNDGDIADLGEVIAYGFSADAGKDANRDGLPDAGGVLPLGRQLGGAGGYHAIADNIEAIGFAYAYDTDTNGLLETNAASTEISWAIPDGAGGWIDLDITNDGNIDINDATPANVTGVADVPTQPAQLQQIRAVQIWILARAGREDRDYVDTNSYKVGANIITPAANDHFRRRLLSVKVRCKNMGL